MIIVLKENPDTTPIFGLEDIKHFGYALCNYLMSNKYAVKYINAS